MYLFVLKEKAKGNDTSIKPRTLASVQFNLFINFVTVDSAEWKTLEDGFILHETKNACMIK